MLPANTDNVVLECRNTNLARLCAILGASPEGLSVLSVSHFVEAVTAVQESLATLLGEHVPNFCGVFFDFNCCHWLLLLLLLLLLLFFYRLHLFACVGTLIGCCCVCRLFCDWI